MAKRPWVNPQEVKVYTSNKKVKARADTKLATDILRAEQHVINYTRNKFGGDKVVPVPVKTAVILIAEAFAISAAEKAEVSGIFQSERFDDYSYTTAATSRIIQDLNLGSLLDEWTTPAQGTTNMRLRRL